ncbi:MULTISPECIES: flagellar motor protein MotB [Devosia]|jgi:chemotaxis protein MotB|uniref:Flagellar motor protein MotB n=1 Tax=Devosia litorisediminis TaxID=2829817 RepID=A0A942EBT8_9HYPH|nr:MULTISPECIES: flagellar motor protein MotB [Devosia]MBS3849509.1 flagellar motor protein MotB [Devosia litorisediminis]MCZ4344476.1 flagellar motor protein MotB [Devosia neptuniae]|tara:strand:+ start:56288 stop:57136 length:849 start_codon:yes stop_codon:yes gene_type:complete
MARKKKVAGGAPEWMVTFGDLMSILVCFFVLLISFSIQDTVKLQVVAGSMREAFGITKTRTVNGVIEKDGNPFRDHVLENASDLPKSQVEEEDNGVSIEPDDLLGLSAAAAPSPTKDDEAFALAAASIRQAWQDMPQLTPFADNLIVENTEEGMDIVISDNAGRRMFPEGSKYPIEPTRKALAVIAPILVGLGHPLRITGHTAAGVQYSNPRYGAWELSSDRANVTRATLGEFGLGSGLIDSVVGRADTEPYFPNDPYLDANERVRISVLKSAPPVPANLSF